MTTAPEDKSETPAPTISLPAMAEELVIENKGLRQRLMIRAAEVDSLRARIITLELQINQEATSKDEE